MNILRNIPWKQPKVWVLAALIVAVLATLPLWVENSNEDKHGRKPYEVVIAYENAFLQKDGVMIKQLATPSEAKEIAETVGLDISLSQGKQNNRQIPSNWVMEEYKVNDDYYLYHIQWFDEETGESGGYYRVKKINDEWRIEDAAKGFELETKGLTPRIIRGTDQQ